jgi:hypothetical protein
MNNLTNPEGSGEAGVFQKEETKQSANPLYFLHKNSIELPILLQ